MKEENRKKVGVDEAVIYVLIQSPDRHAQPPPGPALTLVGCLSRGGG